MDMSEDKFKLALATNLIIFMVNIWANGNENQIGLVNDLMNNWSQGVEKSANHMKKQLVQQMCEKDETMTEDVAMLLLDVNSLDTKTIKGEFKSQMREAIFKGLGSYTES